MSQHACKVDSSPSLDELSERVCSDPVEKDSRYCAAHQKEIITFIAREGLEQGLEERISIFSVNIPADGYRTRESV